MMTPEKRQLIKTFVENAAMFEAVREVVFASIVGSTFEQAVIEDAELLIDDAMFGQLTRARAKGVGFVKRGFAHLQQIAMDKGDVQSVKNEAR